MFLLVPFLFEFCDYVEDLEEEKVVVDAISGRHNYVAELHIDRVGVSRTRRVLTDRLLIPSHHVPEKHDLFDFALTPFLINLGL